MAVNSDSVTKKMTGKMYGVFLIMVNVVAVLLSSISLLLMIVAYSLPYWFKTDIGIHLGLWKLCFPGDECYWMYQHQVAGLFSLTLSSLVCGMISTIRMLYLVGNACAINMIIPMFAIGSYILYMIVEVISLNLLYTPTVSFNGNHTNAEKFLNYTYIPPDHSTANIIFKYGWKRAKEEMAAATIMMGESFYMAAAVVPIVLIITIIHAVSMLSARKHMTSSVHTEKLKWQPIDI